MVINWNPTRWKVGFKVEEYFEQTRIKRERVVVSQQTQVSGEERF
jgi:hypothetical protein